MAAVTAVELSTARIDTDFLSTAAWRLFLAGCFFMPFLVIRAGGTLTFSDILFLLSLMVGAPAIAARRQDPVWTSQIAVIAVLVAVLLSLPVSQDKVSSALNALKLIFVWAVWIWQARALVDSRRRLDRALVAFCYGSVLSSLVAVAELGGAVSITGTYVAGGRASGLAGHPNDQGALLAAGLIIAFGLAVFYGRWTMGVASVFIAVGLVVSGSLSSMAGAIVGLVVLVLWSGMLRQYGPRVFAISVVAVLGALLLLLNVGGYANPLERLNTSSNSPDGGSVGERWATLTAAFKVIRHHWYTGVGFDEKSSIVFQHLYEPHNAFVLALMQGGIPALIASIVVIAPVVSALFRPARSVEGAIALGVFVAMFAYAMTAPVSYQRYAWLGVMLYHVSIRVDLIPVRGAINERT